MTQQMKQDSKLPTERSDCSRRERREDTTRALGLSNTGRQNRGWGNAAKSESDSADVKRREKHEWSEGPHDGRRKQIKDGDPEDRVKRERDDDRWHAEGWRQGKHTQTGRTACVAAKEQETRRKEGRDRK